MSKKSVIYVTGGANDVEMKSGNSGFYIDIDLQSLQDILEDHPEIKRTYGINERPSIRIFASKTKKEGGYYKYYLTAAEKPQQKEINLI